MADVPSFLAGGGVGARAFYTVVRTILNLFCRTFWRTKVIGARNVPRTGPFILAPVHRSNIDTPLACTVTARRMRYMGKDSLWKTRPIGWILFCARRFPGVPRNGGSGGSAALHPGSRSGRTARAVSRR